MESSNKLLSIFVLYINLRKEYPDEMLDEISMGEVTAQLHA